MGRTDEVRVVLEVHAEMRRLLPRLVIDSVDGWEVRGNGLSGDYEGGIVHHTAFKSSATNIWPARSTLIYGRPDLDGPLCNWSGPWCTEEAPRIVVVAAFPANHAGASGGRSMGPLPVTTSFNKRVLGLEIDYAGLTPMTDGQMLVAEVWAKAVAKVVGGGDIERVRAHMETSITGKWDPGYDMVNGVGKTISMADFRKRAKARTAGAVPAPIPQEGFLAGLSDAEQAEARDTLRWLKVILLNGTKDQPSGRVWAGIQRTEALAAKAAGIDVDEAALAIALVPLLRPMLTEMIAAARSSTVTPDALVDEFLARAVAGSEPKAAAG